MSKTSLLLYFACSFFICSCYAEKLIIDTDAGSDDAIAILLLLKAESFRELHLPRYEIIGITCSYGNTKEENVEINVLKTLTMADRSDIPVFAGAKKPLVGAFTSDSFFGKDGFGEAEFDKEITAKIDRSKHAATALVELTKKHEGNVSILMIGPSTNVALATSLDPNFTSRVKKFFVMGSSVHGFGNMKPNVEFNFGADPESNAILLDSTSSEQLKLFPFETGYYAEISKEWRTEVLGKYKSPYMDFINAIERISLKNKEKYYVPTDAMTAALMIWPEIITSTFVTKVVAVVDGAARGSVVVDYVQKDEKLRLNTEIIDKIDSELFMEALVYYLTCEKVAC